MDRQVFKITVENGAAVAAEAASSLRFHNPKKVVNGEFFVKAESAEAALDWAKNYLAGGDALPPGGNSSREDYSRW
jgi:hypothetical protein